MGRDKLGLVVGGRTLVERVYRVLAVRCEEILVAGPLPTGSSTLPGARSVPDLRPGRKGPLAGIEAGLAAASFDRVLVVAGDMPFVSGNLLDFLLKLVSEPGVLAAVPRHGGRLHPLCAAYDRGVLTAVHAALDRDMRAVHEVLEQLGSVRFVEDLERFGDPELLLMNVNTSEDLWRAHAELHGRR